MNRTLVESLRAENEDTLPSDEVKQKLLDALTEFDRQRLELLNQGASAEEAIKLALIGVILSR